MAEINYPQDSGQPDRVGLRVDEVARAIGISVTMAYKLVKSGEIPSAKVGTRRIISVNKLREWIDARSEAKPVKS